MSAVQLLPWLSAPKKASSDVGTSINAGMSISAGVHRASPMAIEFTWTVCDPTRQVRWPKGESGGICSESQRRDELWRETCFEAFISPEGKRAYWELNITWDGRWNLYRFSNYREPTPPEPDKSVSAVNMSISINNGDRCLRLELPLLAAGPLRIGLAAVTQTSDQTSYWALAHTGSHPDFHRSDSFTFPLEGG